MSAITEQFTAVMRPRESATERGAGFACSLALHAVVALLILFGLPSLLKPPLEPPAVIPINLVQFGDKTTSPPADQQAAVPQQQASETATVDAPEAVPVPQAPPPAPTPETP